MIPAGDWPKSCHYSVRPAGKQLVFTWNAGFQGIASYGICEVKEDTLRIGFDLVPWERTTDDTSFAKNAARGFPTDKDQPDGPSTVLAFKRLKK